MKWSQRKVLFYDRHNADEASSSGFIIKFVVTVNFNRPLRYCTLLHNSSALYWLRYYGSSMFLHFKQPLITAIMLVKGLGDLNTDVIISILHLKAELYPE